ncbi:MAG: heme-binding domain-containing protein [Candidatus Binatia bacterium]
MMKWLIRFGAALAIALCAAQLVPLARSNPAQRNFPEAPVEVQALLRRSCNACHSNETVWPWYARVAPASFLITRDVKDGRKKLNLSTWDGYDETRKSRKKKEIAREVGKGDMPPWFYVSLHPEAKLSAGERALIIKWAKQL